MLRTGNDPPRAHIWKDDRSRAWVEHLECANCGKTRTARLSQADGWTVHVDILLKAFILSNPRVAATFTVLRATAQRNSSASLRWAVSFHGFYGATPGILRGLKPVRSRLDRASMRHGRQPNYLPARSRRLSLDRVRVLQGHRVGAVQDAARADPYAQRHDARPA